MSTETATEQDHDGLAYVRLREERGLTRARVSQDTGITGAKMWRIEKKGVFKDDERERLDAYYAGEELEPTPDPAAQAAALLTPELTRDMYMSIFTGLPSDTQGDAHAEATAGFPGAADFDASWMAATDAQRTSALRTIERIGKAHGTVSEKTEPEPEPEPKPTHPDPTGAGRVISDDGRAWVHDGDRWQRDPENDELALGGRQDGQGGRAEFTRWFDLKTGESVKLEGDKGRFTFGAYVVPPRGPAYVFLYTSGKKTRTVAPERVLKMSGAPVIEHELTRGVDAENDERTHAVPRLHLTTARREDGTVKTRCGEWATVTDANADWTSRTLDPTLCPRCVELTGGR